MNFARARRTAITVSEAKTTNATIAITAITPPGIWLPEGCEDSGGVTGGGGVGADGVLGGVLGGVGGGFMSSQQPAHTQP